MTTDAHPAASSHRGGRAFTPGPRKVYLGAALAAIAIAVIVVLAIQPGSSNNQSVANVLNRPLTKKYGHPASWIKIPEPPKQTDAVATAQKPDLGAMEGVPTNATLASGATTQVFAAGPGVPSWVASEASDGKLVAGSTVPSTFTVSFSKTHGNVPLSADQFSLITYEGKILRPTVTNATGGALPSVLPAGKTLTVKLSTQVPEGDGGVRWSPDGKNILVSYFWTLEFD